MSRTRQLWIGIAIVVTAIGLFASGLPAHFRLEELQRNREAWQTAVQAAPLGSAAAFFALYVAVTALAVPGATVLTLAAGALFGFAKGLLLVSFASTAGAGFSFLISRYFLRNWVRRRFAGLSARLEKGFAQDPVGYLLFLRLVPAFPFFAVNLFAGLTSIPLGTFCGVSQLGMLPATALYVNAGTELAGIRSPQDLLTPRVLAAFLLLGLFPLAAKRAMRTWKGRRTDG